MREEDGKVEILVERPKARKSRRLMRRWRREEVEVKAGSVDSVAVAVAGKGGETGHVLPCDGVVVALVGANAVAVGERGNDAVIDGDGGGRVVRRRVEKRRERERDRGGARLAGVAQHSSSAAATLLTAERRRQTRSDSGPGLLKHPGYYPLILYHQKNISKRHTRANQPNIYIMTSY